MSANMAADAVLMTVVIAVGILKLKKKVPETVEMKAADDALSEEAATESTQNTEENQ